MFNRVIVDGKIWIAPYSTNGGSGSWAWIQLPQGGACKLFIPEPFRQGMALLEVSDTIAVEGQVVMQIKDISNGTVGDAWVYAVTVTALLPVARARKANALLEEVNRLAHDGFQNGRQLHESIARIQREKWTAESEKRQLQKQLVDQKQGAQEAILQLMSGGGDAKGQA